MKIKISEIVFDEALYPRSSRNEFLVGRMIANHEAGVTFPPIVVESQTLRLVDGWHRVEVYRRKGVAEIEADIKTYATEADVFADAVRLNIHHGQQLTGYDIRCAIARLGNFGYAREQIAEVVRLPAGNIEDITRGFAVSESSSATPIALKGGLQHLRGQALTRRQEEAQRRYGGGQALHYVRQIALLLNNDLWPQQSTSFADEMDALAAAWIELRKGSIAA